MKHFVTIAMSAAFAIAVLGIALVALFSRQNPLKSFTINAPSNNMRITSSAFGNNETIPSLYTCDGNNINPPLRIDGVSQKAQGLVLLMDDPDVPKSIRPDGMWVHWVIWNIHPETVEIQENSVPQGVIGKNTGGKMAYGGPCPPDREHRYFFKVYALDTILSLPPGSQKSDVEKAMAGHILDSAELIGRYRRQ